MTSAQAMERAGVTCWQRGASLVVSLLMLIVVAMLGISAAQIAINGEKAARNDRDRQLAFQAAEAALLDAELDIDGSPDEASDGASAGVSGEVSGGASASAPQGARSRSQYFMHGRAEGYAPGCGAGNDNIFLGMCASAGSDHAPVWLQVDLGDDHPLTTRSVPYGKFTGLAYPVADGALPIRLPRYIIELIGFQAAGASAEAGARNHLYRITAIGFGMREQSRVVLQSVYRKVH